MDISNEICEIYMKKEMVDLGCDREWSGIVSTYPKEKLPFPHIE